MTTFEVEYLYTKTCCVGRGREPGVSESPECEHEDGKTYDCFKTKTSFLAWKFSSATEVLFQLLAQFIPLTGQKTCRESCKEHCSEAGYQWVGPFVSYPCFTACMHPCLSNKIPFGLIHYTGKNNSNRLFFEEGTTQMKLSYTFAIVGGTVKM